MSVNTTSPVSKHLSNHDFIQDIISRYITSVVIKAMDACEQLSRLNLNSESHKTLHVDVLNMKFMPYAHKMDHFVCVQLAYAAVAQFVRAAAVSQYNVIGFIDAGKQTEETIQKWRQRREKEARTGKRGVPQGTSTLLGDMLRELGVTVHYSTVDNDDTLAAYAFQNGGQVLSADRDFFRYWGDGPPLTVYETYTIQDGKLVLIPHSNPTCKPGVSKRKVLDPLPETYTYDPTFRQVMMENKYIRGVPSPILKLIPNPHSTAKELRRALYARMSEETKTVQESYPQWLDGDVQWVTEDTTSDNTLDHFLDDPMSAWAHVFGHERKPEGCTALQWKQHLFAQKLVCFDICVAAQRLGGETDWTILNLLQSSTKHSIKNQSTSSGSGLRVLFS